MDPGRSEAARDAGIRRLGEQSTQTEWELGRRLQLADIPGGLIGAREQRVPGELTTRQLQVSTLVAQGLTNAQVARQLNLSERTVENHVFNSLAKLGLHNRVQLATWIANGPPPDCRV